MIKCLENSSYKIKILLNVSMKLMYILGFDINIFGFDVSKYDIFL